LRKRGPIDDDEQGHHSAAPEYYGMLAFSLAGRGDLLPVEIDAPTTARHLEGSHCGSSTGAQGTAHAPYACGQRSDRVHFAK
jgi:hypothetical protein